MELDPLTGLGTRREFFAHGEALVARGDRFVLAIANVDHFKRFNLHNGYPVGNEALRALAAQMVGLDAFRIGGDTFALFVADAEAVEVVRRSVAKHVNPAQPERCGDKHCMGIAPAPRLSIGVSTWSSGPFKVLVASAEEALQRAKVKGRDRLEVA